MKLAPLLLCCALLPPLVAQENPPTAAPTPAPAEPEVVKLLPFKVRGNAVGNFAISVQILVTKEPKKTQIIISRVMPFSDASQLGLREGDEILKINGQPVADMDPKISPDSPLGRLLLNRKVGEGLDLEVTTVRTRSLTLRAGGAVTVH
jgi:membrane-associated protease RseP (regulator of RpoE activity)